jgi:hypothetical protein
MTVDVANARPTGVMTFQEKVEYARFLAASNMLPAHFQRKPESVLWAMEYGEALGLKGVVAMSAVHVIENKPSPSAAMAAGLIRSRGHRLRIFMTPATDQHKFGTAVAELTRADDPEFTFRTEWSVEDAVRAQICKIGDKGELLQWSSKASKWQIGNWHKYPRQMMKARALGEVCRDAATDVLLGLHYLAEEMEDVELDSNGQLVTQPDAQVPTVRASSLLVEDDARPLAEHVPGGDVDTSTSESSAPDDTPPTTNLDEVTRASADQVRELNIRMTNLGVKTRERKLRLIGLALGSEPPGSSADLSVAQFRKVMQELSGEDELTVAAWLDQGNVDTQT